MSDAAKLTTLRKEFKGELVTPDDPDYAAAIARWASNAARPAKLVAFVANEEDVALALRYAREQRLPLAVCGGGHSASGASSADGGLVIDLSRHLNGARIDPEHKLAFVGGGAIWKTVDEEAIKHGLATVGGTVNHTGVGGLTLGGGYGWLTGAHGMVVDNLHQVTIVTADGKKLTVDDNENPDLFWGVRGGGGNFGVVTEFVYRLHPQRRTVFMGPLIFPPPALQAVVAAADKWWERGPSNKEAIALGFTRGPDRNPCIILMLFYNGSAEEGKANYKDFYALNPVAAHANEIPYEAVGGLMADKLPHGIPTYIKGVAVRKPVFEAMQKAFERVVQASEDPETEVIVLLEFLPQGKMLSAPPGATAFNRRKMLNAIHVIRWKKDTPESLQKAREAALQIGALMASGNTNVTEEDSLGYGNYDAEGGLPEDYDGFPFSGKSATLYGDNYPRLQALKKKYDPEMVFNKWFVVTPA